MPRVISPESEEGKELLRWEQWAQHWNGTTYTPGNPYVFRPYPKMLYRAVVKDNGKAVCMEPPPQPDFFEKSHEYDRAVRLNDALNKACQRIVQSEAEHLIAKGQGWCETASEALAAHEAEQQAIGTAAAERAYADQRMSAKAQAEAHAADAATHEHVADVPVPKKRPYRRKVKRATTPAATE